MHAKNGKWQAQIYDSRATAARKSHYIGCFATEVEAARAHDVKARELGKRCNFPLEESEDGDGTDVGPALSDENTSMLANATVSARLSTTDGVPDADTDSTAVGTFVSVDFPHEDGKIRSFDGMIVYREAGEVFYAYFEDDEEYYWLKRSNKSGVFLNITCPTRRDRGYSPDYRSTPLLELGQ